MALNATATGLGVEAGPPTRVLLCQFLTLVLSLALGRESTPVAVLALRNGTVSLTALLRHKHNLVTAVLQINDSWLKAEGLDSLHIAVTHALSLTEHRLHHIRDVTRFLGRRVAPGRFLSDVYVVVPFRRLNRGLNGVVIIKNEIIKLLLVHHFILGNDSAVSLSRGLE